MKRYVSESTVKPPEWDKTSSDAVVYHNTDIVEVPASEEKPRMYTYIVEEYTRSEYLEYENENLQQSVNALWDELDAAYQEGVDSV